jgi:hypothetical protein
VQIGAAVVTGRPPQNRSGLTNDPRRLSADVDGRGAEGRRFSDIFDLVALEFPGANPLRIRDIALLKYELERAQGAGNCSLEDVVRVHNLIGRREKELRAEAKRVKPPQSSVSSILARRMPVEGPAVAQDAQVAPGSMGFP